MKFGLTDIIVTSIVQVFETNAKIDKAYVFGSRAKGNFKEGSDIDIAIKGSELTFKDILQCTSKLEELNLPYKIDLLDYDKIKEPALIEHIDRVGVEFYRRWKEYKLGDVTDTINGYAFKSTDFLDNKIENSLPIIKIKNVANGDVHLNDCHFHKFDKSLQKFLVHKNDILIALTGNHPEVMTQVVGEASRYKFEEKALLNQRVAKIIAKVEINDDFLYYYLKDDSTHNYLASQSAGSANQANISKADIENVSINLPPLKEQITIANILSSLDDKIDLLHRQNKTLEQLAETLFRQMMSELGEGGFKDDRMMNEEEILKSSKPKNHNSDKVVEGEESWEVGTLGDLVFVKYGKDHKKLLDGKIPVYGSGGIMRYADTALYNEESVLIPRKGTLNNVIYIDEPFWTVDTMFYTVMKKPNLAKFIFHFVKKQDLSSMNIGSAVPSMTNEILNNMEIIIPPDKVLRKFDLEISTYYKKIKSNQTQISTLTKLRDILLPKLMSGEVRVQMSEL